VAVVKPLAAGWLISVELFVDTLPVFAAERMKLTVYHN
jgi:hypothetical protein